MNMHTIRRTAATGLAATALTVGTLAAVAPAHAAPAAASQTASVATSSVSNVQASSSWRYYGKYFWGWKCTSVGNHKVTTGQWSAYQCRGSWFEDYKLYYRL